VSLLSWIGETILPARTVRLDARREEVDAGSRPGPGADTDSTAYCPLPCEDEEDDAILKAP
jgi:hypothetical protein